MLVFNIDGGVELKSSWYMYDPSVMALDLILIEKQSQMQKP